MKRIYIYPKNDYEKLESPNPYILHLEAALQPKHRISNQHPNKLGVLELFLFLFKTDVYLFNWIEDLPVKRYGKFQAILLLLFLLFSKVFRKKIIWVMHNLFSHERKSKKWTHFLFIMMIRHSGLILTHSEEGIRFLRKNYSTYCKKAIYINHPVDELLLPEKQVEKEYDLFIWGTIHPYKGVLEFLEFASGIESLNNLKMLIAGICPNSELKAQLYKLLTKNIEYRDGFFDIEEIAAMTYRSKVTVFTYNSDSILSSGSLMDSIRMGAMIIGPNKGSFRDLRNYTFIETYNSFSEIPDLINRISLTEVDRERQIIAFYKNNNWETFGDKLISASQGIL